MLTASQLKKIMPHTSQAKRDAALPILNEVAKNYDINNERRMAGWLATLAVESGELKYQEEIASGAAYEGRKDLGNTERGDGRRFKGHGRIQITGRANHQAYTNYLKRSKHLPFIDFVAQPQLLAQEPYATDAAGWFWAVYKKLNGPADRGDFLTTQIKVNGRNKKTGLPNHWKERNAYWIRALSVLPDDFSFSAAVAPMPDSTASTSDDAVKNERELTPPQTGTQAGQSESTQTQPPNEITARTEKETDGTTQTVEVTQKNEQSVTEPAQVTTTQYRGVGFIGALKRDFAAVGGGNLSFQMLQEYATQASGWPPWVISLITKVATIAVIVGGCWLLFRLAHYVIWKVGDWKRMHVEADINSDVTRKNLEWK